MTNTILVVGQKSKQDASLAGKIVDVKTNAIIEFATVSIFSLDSSLVDGTTTTSDGYFLVQDLPYGNYYIEIAFIGYAKKTINDVVFTKEKKAIDLGIVQLESFSKNMDEFNVVEEKELVEIKIDKTVYNVSKDPASQGGNGLDVLKTLPSVDVDLEDNISLRNDNSVQVLIDGKPSPIPAKQLLKDIPSSLIEKIEIITNPSSKYNPEGMSGIINVVLKKEKAVGFNGSISGSLGYGSAPRYNSSLSLNYRKKKWSIFANAGVYKGEWKSVGLTKRTYLTADSLYFQDLEYERIGTYTSVWYSSGFDYHVNDRNTFFVEISGWNGGGTNLSDNQFNALDNNQELSSYSNRITDGTSGYNGADISMGWQAELDEDGDHTLDFDFDVTKNIDKGEDNISEHFYLSNDAETGIPFYQNTKNPGDDYAFEGFIDYVYPINDSLEVEAGGTASYTDAKREFYSESNINSTDILPDENLNNEVTFVQKLAAAYLTFGKQFKKVGVKVGSRFESVDTKIKLINDNTEYKKHYTSFFPSAYLTYQVSKKNELKLSYSRRVNRPNEWEINPFTSFSDPYSYRVGNPDLNPEYINVYEFGYMFQGSKVTLTPNVYYRQVTDKKTRFISVTDEGILITTYNNSGELVAKGIELITRYSPFEFLRLNASLNMSQSTFKDLNLEGTPNSTTNNWRVKGSSSLTLNKGFSIQLNAFYRGKNVQLQGTSLPAYSFNIGVRKTVLKEKGTINLRVNDIFNTREYNYLGTDLGGYSTRTHSKWVSQTIYISFNYSFGSIKMDDGERRDSNRSSSGDSFDSGNGGK